MLIVWIICGIPNVSQGKVRGLSASSTSFPLYVLLKCTHHWFGMDPSRLMWSFLRSFIRVRELLVGICSLLELDCREWRRNSSTRIYVFYNGQAFFSLIFFSVVLSKSMCIALSPSTSFVIFFIHWTFLLCFWLPYCRPKIVLLYPVAGIFSCHRHQNVGRILFFCFGMYCFVCIVLPFVEISLTFLLSPVLTRIFPQVVLIFFLFCFFSFLSLKVLASFLCFIMLACFRGFFICVSSRISHPGFDFFFVLFCLIN